MISILLGSTGAVGRELLECLLSSSKYSQIILPLRNPLKEWENYPLEQREKMKIIKRENFDFLNGTKEELIEILGTNEINSFFNCLGSVTAKGEEELRILLTLQCLHSHQAQTILLYFLRQIQRFHYTLHHLILIHLYPHISSQRPLNPLRNA